MKTAADWLTDSKADLDFDDYDKATDQIEAIQADARQSAAREAAVVACAGHLVSSGCAYGTQTDIHKAILAHFNLEDGK